VRTRPWLSIGAAVSAFRPSFAMGATFHCAMWAWAWRRHGVGVATRAVIRLRVPSQPALDKTENLSRRNEEGRIGLILRAQVRGKRFAMPKPARPRGRAALTALALVPRQHAAPASGAELPSEPARPSSGRAVTPSGGRTRVAVLAFLLGFAACYVVLNYVGGPGLFPQTEAATPSAQTAAP
jgi:hypothetical protein